MKASEPLAGGILRRASRNAGLLLGGKSAAGLMQLGTFALAARGLGVNDFGQFSVIIAVVMLLTGIAAFDSNQAVIRYGVPHLSAGNRPGMQALFKAGTLLDFGAATAAAIATVIAAPFIAPHVGWDPHHVLLAQLAAPLSFTNAISTPKGMLRLFGRFDLLTIHSIITPAARLVFFVILTLADAKLGWYVAAWLIAAWIGAAVAVAVAWREAHRLDLLLGMNASLRGLSTCNPGVWKFSVLSNLNSTVSLIPTQLSVVLVAALLGPAAAGFFRIARELGTAMMKPVNLANQALYPDLARLVLERSWPRLIRAALRAGVAAASLGAVLTALVYALGPIILTQAFGKEFIVAAPLLVAVAIGTSIRVIAFAADPVMYALGRPGVPLAVSLASAAVFVVLLLWRLPEDGLVGASWAFLAMGLSAAILSAASAVHIVKGQRRRDQSGAEV